MNEEIFRSILEKAVMSEYADLDNEPEHKFSLKHRLAMKRIFARYERNVRKLRKSEVRETTQITESKPRYRLSRQLFLAMIVIILATFLVGWVVVYVSTDFHGVVFHDHTVLTPKNVNNCPQTIEYKYEMMFVPDEFELVKSVITRTSAYTLFKDKNTNRSISVVQWVKKHYEPSINTEYRSIEEININNEKGLCVDFSDTTHDHTIVVWDNGDYIIEIVADLDKEDTINLSKINKV